MDMTEEMTEEQRKRAEANRLAALAKRRQAAGNKREDPEAWRLFKCRKILPEPSLLQKPVIVSCEVPKPQLFLPSKIFRVRLEICSPDSFSATPEPLPDSPYPGDAECLQRLNDCLSFVVPLRYTQNQSGGNGSVYNLWDYDMILKCLKSSKGIECQEIPHVTLRAVQSLSDSFVTGRWFPCRPEHLPDDVVDALIGSLPKTLLDSLFPFQLDGVRFALRRGGRCLIADEMGLGKTLQAIAIASCFINEGPILVVCPAILRYSWAEELERWLPSCVPTDIHLVFGHENNPARLTRCPRVVVTSYTMLHHLRNSMLELEWALWIVDESHHIRCSKKASEHPEIQAVLDVAKLVKRIILLSGTPSLSRPYDIFHQIDMLWPGLLGKNKFEFAKNYCPIKSDLPSQAMVFKRDFSKGIRLEELNVLLKISVMIRRLKKQVLVQLPPKRRQIIRLVLKRSDIISAKAAIERSGTTPTETQEESELHMNDDGDCYGNLGNLSYQEVGIAKLSGFCNWFSIHPIVTNIWAARNSDMDRHSHKMIIFAHHHAVLDKIQAFTCQKGVGFVRVDGLTSALDRQLAIQSFRSSPEVNVAIIGITVGALGLDLSVAENVVFLELPKTSNELVQAEDRAHRRGQTKAVNVYIFCAKDTLDELHWQKLNKELHCVSCVTNGKKDAVEEIGVEKVSDQYQEGSFAQYKSSEDDENEDMKAASPGSNNSSKTDISFDKKKFLDNVVSGELPQMETVDPHNTALNQGVQDFKMHIGQMMVKDESHKQIDGDGYSSMQENLIHFESGRGSDLEMADDSSLNGSLEGDACEPREPRSPGIVSTCKLYKSTDKNEPMANMELEGVLFPNAELPSDQKYTVNTDRDYGSTMLIEAGAAGSIQSDCLRFEVSQYTGRIHLYSCVSGRDPRPKPLFQNFRPEELESLNFSVVGINKGRAPKFIQENPTYRDILLAFITEWNGLTPFQQKKLLGKPLQLPLSLELCYLKEGINHGSGGLLKGGSKRRATPLYDISHPLPENAIRKMVSLRSGNGKKEKTYAQGWSMTDEPLCKLCQAPCKGNLAKTPEYLEDLFCTLDCFEEFRIRTSQRSLREALFQIELGICRKCKLDCHKLIKCIKPLSIAKRKQYIEKVAPKVASHKNLFEKLVHEPIEGNAWHADHIVPVYRGGGECRLENMRTLCVACHSEVTASQHMEQRLARAKAKEQLKEIMKSLKNGSNIEQISSNLEGCGHSDMQEVTDAELFIKVPGSAYSESTAQEKNSSEVEMP
ncbi:DNA annealing helicase and endonuclease ZRANB3 isoform X2 [Telopea speciosissima]|uniref:DNA annealing helicase and endonuclease ZRANB3 isoform X2 n=1 Tax=Telopea speciosissima TaxID=54955 RepID=UPI001CC3DB54|nr:DNA annealing helicase and endonuclease ZRANB3 isoform X2 [Telopea speciosissima]